MIQINYHDIIVFCIGACVGFGIGGFCASALNWWGNSQ